VLHLRLIILSVAGDVSVDSETLLVTDFMNLKIKSVQSFGYVHRDKLYIHTFIKVNVHIYIYIYKYLCLYCISKKIKPEAGEGNY
jgi:hypothetical protein